MTGQSSILVIEDSDDDRVSFQRVIRASKVRNSIQFVTSGEEAKEYFNGGGKFANREEFPFPVLMFIDMRMPRVSGLEFLQWLNEKQLINRVFCVVLSGLTDIREVNEAYRLGAKTFLVKPITVDDLRVLFTTKGMQMIAEEEGYRLEYV